MRSLPRIPIDVPVNSTSDALAALERLMLELDYTGRCRCDAKTIVRRTGCVADCVPERLDREHLAVVEQAYVDALPVVPWDDPAWGHVAAAIMPPELDDDDAEFHAALSAYWPGGEDSA